MLSWSQQEAYDRMQKEYGIEPKRLDLFFFLITEYYYETEGHIFKSLEPLLEELWLTDDNKAEGDDYLSRKYLHIFLAWVDVHGKFLG